MKQILAFTKTVEFRRKLPRRAFSTVILYESSPTKKIVGIATVSEALTSSRSHVWTKTSLKGGISRRAFLQYFRGSETANAIFFSRVEELKRPVGIRALSATFTIPQSFSYVDNTFLAKIRKLGGS